MQLKNIENFYPLSPMQQGMLFHSLYEPEAGIYIVQTACHIQGDMNADAFERAWQQAVERHPILRTAFVWEDLDEPVQVVQRQVRITMDCHDWRALPASEQHTRLMALLQADRERGFDLAAAPLLRLALVQVDEYTYEFIWSRHHILLDGWSEALVLEDVLACYEAICDGKEIQVTRRRPYRDYIAWLRRQDLAQAEAFWRRSLGSFSAPTPLGLDAAPADLEEGYDELRIQFSMTGLQALARRQRVTLNTLLQGAWVLLLSRYSGEEDIVFGVTVSGRPPDLAGSDVMVGLFINTLPVRVPARLGEPLLPWLKQLQAQQVEMRQYEYSPLVQVQGWSDVPRGMPLFESIMVFENFPMNAFLSKRSGRLAIQKMEFEQQTNYPLTVVIMPELTVLTLHISYDRRRFDAAVIARMLGHLQTLLEGMVADPERRLADLPIMTAAEREQLLVAWNDTATAYPRAERVHELFAAQAARAPDAVAVVFDSGQGSGVRETRRQGDKETRRQGVRSQESEFLVPNPQSPIRGPQSSVLSPQSLTYAELNIRANQLAHYLRSLGVGPDVRVAVCVERSLELVIGVLGVLKAGGAYLPLDPAYPPERIAFMLEDAQASVLITTTDDRPTTTDDRPTTNDQLPQLKTQNLKLKTQSCTPSPCHLVTLSESWPAIARYAANDPVGTSDPANLAYVIYTSGSTGSPKGVMTPQRAMGNLSAAFRDVLDLGPDDRFLMIPSLSFDASVGDIFPTLITGAALVLPRAVSELSGVDLLRLCEQQRVTIMDIPAAFWQQWVNDLAANRAGDILAALKLIIVGGESVAGDRLRTWTQLTGGHVTFFGPYGPTETTVCTTFFKLAGDQAAPHDVSRLPIGRPIGNAQVYVLDRFLNPVPIGAPGEVYIGGAGVARGYLNHPALTAERFVPNPFAQGMGDGGWGMGGESSIPHPPSPIPRLYRTGDLARWRADGNLEFLGRVDQQVKVRGFRIELGEIEVALRQHPAVQESAVVVREDGPGEKRLVAYVVTSNKSQVTSSAEESLVTRHSLLVTELRAFLRERLPDYMVPAAFVTLDALPVTANGKVDRRRLPAPDTARPELGETFVAPESPVEAQLAAIWSQVLGVERVGIHDNFFALGGDSILSLQIITRANQAGLRLTPKLLFQHPMIAELAPAVGAQPAMQLDQGLVTGPVTLTPIQRWFFEQDLADPHHWNQAMLLEARQPLDPALLERAVQHLLLHHDALRLRFTRGEAGWQQTNARVEERSAFSLVNLPATAAAERAAAIEVAATRMQASLNLSEGPIMRVALIDPGEREPGRVLIVIHHLAVDGVSWRILLEDLQTAYGQLSHGEELALPPKTTSFQQWAERLAAYARSQAIQKDADYWLAASWPALALPRDLSGADADNTEESARSVTAALSAGETQSLLTEVPAAYRTQINDALLTALAQACARWTGAPELLVDLEGHGREPLFEDADVSRTVGWFTTSFPVLLNVDTQHPGAALKAVKEQLRGVPNGGIGYGLLRYLSADQASRERLRGLPQAEVSFNYLGQLDQALPEASLFGVARESSGPAHSLRARRSHLLEVNGFVAGGRLHLEWIYSEQMHRRASIERLAESFMERLRALIAHCLSPDAGGYTPSDFALAGLDQRQLDRLIGSDRQVEDLYPLSPAQQGMLFHSLYAPQSGVYVEQMSCLLGGELQAALLQRSVQYVVDQHPALRAAYVWDGLDEPLQLVRRRASVPFEQIDWRDAEPAVQRERLAALLQADRVRGFDLSAAPLMRLILIRMGERSYHFVWSFHHMLLDGWSGPRVLQQVFACYEAYRRGQEPRLEHSRPYREYIAWLRGQDQARTEAFWRQMLAGITAPTPLGVDRASVPSPERESSYAEQELRLSTETTAALQALARQQQLTLNTILEGAWALLLSCYSRESDVVFGITVSGRPAALSGVESMVGMFINTLPVRAKVVPEERLLPWLKRLQDQQIELLQYEYSSLMQVQGWSELPRGVSLFDSILVFENYPVDDALRGQGGSLRVEGVHAFEQTNYPLTVMAAPGAALSLRITYDCDRFDAGTISRMAGHLQTLLEGVAANPQRHLADVPLMTNAERQQLLVEWNATAADYPLETTLHRLVETQVARTPDAVAVVFDHRPPTNDQRPTTNEEGSALSPQSSVLSPQSLTYAELNRQANQLAHYLHALGVEVDTPVAVCLHRSLDLVVALLGVLKAGGAYVPLDPSYPAERLTFMLQDSQAAVLITTNDQRPTTNDAEPRTKNQEPQDSENQQPATDDELKTQNSKLKTHSLTPSPRHLVTPSQRAVVRLDAERPLLTRLRATNPRPTTRPDNLAYMIYTSGSTGTPKGAMNAHRAIVNRLLWMQESYQLTSADVVLQKTPFSFDVSVWEFFWPLLTGARLVLARPGGHQDSAYLVELIATERISTLHFVPAMLGVFLAEENLESCTALVRVICSGEALPRELQSQFFAHLHAELHNLYGPTEAAVDVSAWACAPSQQRQSVPIGRPIANTQLYVLDLRLQPAPIGVAGELYIGGVQLARGYWQRPALTAERFLPNPFAGVTGDGWWVLEDATPNTHHPTPNTRLYRTGDLARIDAEGVIEYLGRTDTQVKLRGFRIELGEVEARLREHPSLREVAVVAREDLPGDVRLVGYVVTSDKLQVTSSEDSSLVTRHSLLVTELRGFLSERLPSYMVPALLVVLEALPLTPSGKVDRRALPAPDGARPSLAEAYAAPQSAAEQTLAAIWTEVLGVRQVGIEDNFFALGGDSIRSIRVVALARARGLHLSLPLLFQHQTIRALTDALGLAEGVTGDAVSADELAAMEEPTSAPFSLVGAEDRAKLPEEVEDAYPLITLQSGMLFHSEFQPDSAVYHDIFTHHLRAPLELELLRQALQAVVQAHPVLRTAFDLTSYSQPLQLVYRQLAVELAHADLRALAPAEQERALAAWVAAEQQRGFVWSQPPLLRLQLHRRSEDSFQLTLSFHHAILDGWSVAALLTELFTRYFGALGADVALPQPPQATYRDFVALERAALESAEARAYWTDLLRDASRMFLPRWPMQRSEGEVRKVRTHPVPLDADVADGLRQLARAASVPIKSVLLAAHLRVMSLLGGQSDVLTGLVANGRPELADGERVLGLFLNTLPLRVALAGGSWRELVQAAFAAERELLPFRRFPLAEIQRLTGGQPLFEAAFNFVHFHVYEGLSGIKGLEPLEGEFLEETNFTLVANFDLDPSASQVHMALEYDTTQLSSAQIEAIGGYYARTLAAMASAPDERYEACSLLSDAERQQLVMEWNATAADYPLETTLHRLIETQVARTPDAVAVVFDQRPPTNDHRPTTTDGEPRTKNQEPGADTSPITQNSKLKTQNYSPNTQHPTPNTQHLTYAELNRHANQLAHYLHALGVEVDTPVAVCLHRSLELVVALLGVLKAGGAYVPLDPSYPHERLDFMLQDSQATVLITTNDVRAQSKIQNPKSKIVDLDAERHLLARLRATNPRPTTRPDNLAYMIYTSGSTGTPKGAMNAHRAIVNRLLWMQESYQLTSADVVLQKTPFSFDVSVWEFFWPLLTGARLVLARPGGHQDSAYLVELIATERISTLHFVPAMLGVFLAEENLESCTALVRVICSGEALPRELQSQFFAHLHAELHNLYGPTEAAVDVSAWACAPSQQRQSVPIGRPIANTQLYVLDPRLQPAPIGVAGELYIGGVQLARGYWQRPDLTAERFLPNPFAGVTGDGWWVLEDATPNTHHPTPTTRLYRTGDLARIDAEGVIEYLGRTDTQVKLRGFRIELGEVEARLREHPSLREVAVVAREDLPGDVRLVGYVVTSDKLQVTSSEDSSLVTRHSLLVTELRGFLSERLPSYMVPALLVVLEALPLTPSGKVDRRALPAPDGARPALAEAYTAPQSAAEQTLAAIWTEVLGVRQVGIEDNFFALGGDSIRSIRVVALARTRGLHLSLPLLFQHQTIRALTDALGLAEGAAGDAVSADELAAMEEPTSAPFSLVGAEDRAKLPEEVEDAYPLITLQSGMLFHSEFQPDSAVYHDIFTHHLRAPLELELLRQALQAVVQAHPVLRTAFDLTSYSQPLQLVYRQLAVELAHADLRALAPAEQERALAAWVAAEQQRGFVWSQPPLLRLQLHRRSEDSFQLTLSFHHAILDGWSVAALLTELFTRYFGALGADVALPQPPQATYRDFVALERAALESAEARAYWTDLLRDASRMFLPRWSSTRRETDAREVRARHVPIAAETVDHLKQLARTAAVPIKSVFFAAHLRVMSLLGGQSDVLTGLVANGRPELADGERVLGLFLNTLPLRVALAGGSWRELVQAAFAAERELLPFRRFPLAEIQRLTGGQPLFEAAFNYNDFHVYQNLGGIKDLQPLDGQLFQETNFTLVANFNQDPTAQMQLTLEYDANELTAEQIEQVSEYYIRALAAMASAPDERYEARSLLSDEERQLLLLDWNATAASYSLETTLHGLIEAQAARTPNAIAVVFDRPTTNDQRPTTTETRRQGDKETRGQGSGVRGQNDRSPLHPFTPSPLQQLTYHELNERANRLAHYLRTLGVGPDVPVAVCLERSLDLVVALLGVLKAGGAYVPLDPSYPAERLTFMLEDSRAAVLITTNDQRTDTIYRVTTNDVRSQSKIQNPKSKIVHLDAEQAQIARMRTDNPAGGARPDDLAYIIYTSGSTGRPKGIQVAHRAFANRLLWSQATYPLDATDRVLQLASMSFDISLWELLGPLVAGARLMLVRPGGHQDLPYLIDLIADQQITVAHFVPSLLQVLLAQAGIERWRRLRIVFCGGEAVPADLPGRFFAHLDAQLHQFYGPTEAAINATAWACERANRQRSLPIGRPIANTQIYLLDRQLQPVPIGVPGELHIGGAGLARGYLGRPDLTAERFIPNPFAQGMGDGGWGMGNESSIPHPPSPIPRLYKTGDLARYRPDGAIEYLGRLDHQVKIRGFRVELGEVEAALAQHPALREALVVAREDLPGDVRLVAYLVTSDKLQVTSSTDSSLVTRHSSLVAELRDFLKERLPDYMLPSAFVVLDAIPLLPNGKIDRRALPSPEGPGAAKDKRFVAPRTPTEAIIAKILAEVLVLERVGVYDNFFELGGHSLLAMQLIARLREAFQVALPLRTLYEAATVADLAMTIIQQQAEQSDSALLDRMLAELDQLSEEEAQTLLVAGEEAHKDANP